MANADARLAELLALEQRLRACEDLNQLGYLVVNDFRLLVAYRSGWLWLENDAQVQISAVSGLPEPERGTPFYHWASKLCASLESDDRRIRAITPHEVSAELADEWHDYLPDSLLWIPLTGANGTRLGSLVYCRDAAWREDEVRIIALWADAVSHAIKAFRSAQRSRFGHSLRRSFRWIRRPLVLSLLVIAILMMPVSLSVLVPGEVVALQPQVVRAPVDGVVEQVLVQPNEQVSAGSQLIRLDTTELRAQEEEAIQAFSAARAALLRARQSAVNDLEQASKIPQLQSLVRQKQASLALFQGKLARTTLTSDRSGIVLMDNPDKMAGLPVRVGQRLLSVASPDQAAIELWIPVADNIPLPAGAPVDLFLNIAPDAPVGAKLEYIHYQAEEDPRGILAFRARARINPELDLPRIGLHGTAQVHGDSVRLGYLVFRRPVATLRRWLGV